MSDIDDIDAILAKAAPRPWQECGRERGGCTCGQIWSLPVDAHIMTALAEWEGGTISREARVASAALARIAVNAFAPMRAALNYIADMTYCGTDAEWHFKPGYDPQIVLDALASVTK